MHPTLFSRASAGVSCAGVGAVIAGVATAGAACSSAWERPGVAASARPSSIKRARIGRYNGIALVGQDYVGQDGIEDLVTGDELRARGRIEQFLQPRARQQDAAG